MAIPFHQERQDFELRKIHEALQPADIPSQRDDAIGGPLVASEAEAPRTRRFARGIAKSRRRRRGHTARRIGVDRLHSTRAFLGAVRGSRLSWYLKQTRAGGGRVDSCNRGAPPPKQKPLATEPDRAWLAKLRTAIGPRKRAESAFNRPQLGRTVSGHLRLWEVAFLLPIIHKRRPLNARALPGSSQ